MVSKRVFDTMWGEGDREGMQTTARAGFTLRLEPEINTGLERLSTALHRPKNKLINEAVRMFVAQRSRVVGHELEEIVAGLREYRKWDPDFDDAIGKVAEDEARYGADDPVEGRAFRLDEAGMADPTGIREILNA